MTEQIPTTTATGPAHPGDACLAGPTETQPITSQVYSEIPRHLSHLRSYALSMARDPVVADDLVQECVTRALGRWHLFREGTNLRAWLFTIMHNLHVSEVRRASRFGHAIDPEQAASMLATPPDQERGLVMRALDNALGALPGEQRAAIEMVAIDGLSYEDVAETLRLPVGTVKSRISRGRTVLRSAVEGRERRPRARSLAA